MFESSLLPNAARRRAFSLGYVIEGVALGFIVLYPLIHSEALPSSLTSATYIPAPPHAAAVVRRPVNRQAVRVTLRDLMAAPVTIPTRIVQLTGPPAALEPPAVGIAGSIPGGDAHGLPGGIGAAIP